MRCDKCGIDFPEDEIITQKFDDDILMNGDHLDGDPFFHTCQQCYDEEE